MSEPKSSASKQLGTVAASEELIYDLYISLRWKINDWAKVTEQTAQARMGYIGQHLVSVVTGYKGGKSGARGRDLVLPDNKSGEIKTCYRVDQLGKCLNCGAGVASIESQCASCGSTEIDRKDDSKWLIGIRNDQEFEEILDPSKYYLVLFDFADKNKPTDVRANIWVVEPMIPGFAFCMVDYYLEIRSKSSSKAPFNLWPYLPKFELMRPMLIYSSLITDTVKTEIFPGRDNPQVYPLSPLATFARSRNVTPEAIDHFANWLGVKFRESDTKAERLAILDTHRSKVPIESFVDHLADAVYWPRISQHVAQLPARLRTEIKKIKKSL